MVILDHRTNARRPRAVVTIALVLAALLGVWLVLDAAWWVIAPLALLTLPAVVEAVRGDVATLTLDDAGLAWSSRRHSGAIARQEIAHVRFDTRMDFAVNARLHLVDGRVIRLPVECLPPYPIFCSALDSACLKHERHHFGFL